MRTYSIVKDQDGPHDHTSTLLLLAQSRFDTFLDPNKRKKGGHFLVAALLKPICCSKAVRSPCARHD
jgi:hypothetical protein